MKAIEVDSLGGCFVQMDIGFKWILAAMTALPYKTCKPANLQSCTGSTNRTVPEWRFEGNSLASAPSKTQRLPIVHPRCIKKGGRGYRGLSATAPAYQPSSRVGNSIQLPPDHRHFHLMEVKYCEDTRPKSQLEAAHHQLGVLCQHLCRTAANVSLYTILLGVGGAIYSPFNLEPLKYLGLNPQKVIKLAVKLHAHSKCL